MYWVVRLDAQAADRIQAVTLDALDGLIVIQYACPCNQAATDASSLLSHTIHVNTAQFAR